MTTVLEREASAATPSEGGRAALARTPRRRPGAVWRGVSTRPLTAFAVGASMLFVAGFGIVGADTYWLVAMGDHIASAGAVPDGIPFAAADTAGWPNPLVLAQLLLAALATGGPGVLLLAQVLCVGTALVVTALVARRAGAGDGATAAVLGLLVLGSLLSLGIVRLQLLSLVPFAALLLLLHREHADPSRRIWLAVPLVALWSNLHGAVLMGVAVLGAHLLFSRLRRRPVETVAVGVASLAALLLTPALLQTVPYYHGVLTNVAAQRGSDLWARPDLGHPADLLMVLAAVGLAAVAVRRRPPVWECVAVLGLAASTASSARHGVWLLLVLAVPAAVGLTRRTPVTEADAGTGTDADAVAPQPVPPRPAAVALGLLGVLLLATSLVVAPLRDAAAAPHGHASAPEITRIAAGRVVLAPEPLAESLAAAGATVWAADPVDAFHPQDQAAFLDALTDGPTAERAVAGSEVVVAEPGSPTARVVERVGGFRTEARVGPFLVMSRTNR